MKRRGKRALKKLRISGKGLSPNPNYGMEKKIRIHHSNAVKPEGGMAMGETVEVIISVLFFGGWLFFLSWAWGRVGHKLGYSFWAFALTFWVIVFAIISIILLGLRIHVGHETLELLIGVSYYGGFFLLSGWLWGKVARRLGHAFWAHALTFWLAPITLLYLGFRREKRQIPVDSPPEESSSNSP